MQGRGGRREDEEQRRRRQRGASAPDPTPDYSAYLATGAAVAATALAGYGAYKLIWGGRQDQPQEQSAQEEHLSNYNVRQIPRTPTSNWSGWFDYFKFMSARELFWKSVKEEEKKERSAIKEEVSRLPPTETSLYQYQQELEHESAAYPCYKHKYNKFDIWFQKLLSNVLKINNDERKEFVEAFDEIIEVLLKEMGEVDRLFRYMYRTYSPAGSSWEDLRICTPDEFDVNLILLPTDIQENVKVEDVGSGHIAIRLDQGFVLDENKLAKKLDIHDKDRFKSNYDSIKAQLRNWVENSYVSRYKVIYWMQGVVDKALLKLSAHSWTHVQFISRRMSGPAVTVKVTMKNGKVFCIDLVPAFEFNQKHLPGKTQHKVRAKQVVRTWYAIPKGPPGESPPKMWRTSLYQAERDIMTGHNHLKPSIRIMKRLRDERMWTPISSYYLKTNFMWMMDKQNHWQMSLGQIVMSALISLRVALQNNQIKYYWDDELNLLDKYDKEFFKNVSGSLTNIIEEFEKSVNDESVNPMRHFGCDKNGKLLTSRNRSLPRCFNEGYQVVGSQTNRTLPNSPSSSNEADCVVM